jgi:hypothetical protein
MPRSPDILPTDRETAAWARLSAPPLGAKSSPHPGSLKARGPHVRVFRARCETGLVGAQMPVRPRMQGGPDGVLSGHILLLHVYLSVTCAATVARSAPSSSSSRVAPKVRRRGPGSGSPKVSSNVVSTSRTDTLRRIEHQRLQRVRPRNAFANDPVLGAELDASQPRALDLHRTRGRGDFCGRL